ncbi:MAG: S-layer homology domain-containing protein [Clostridiales bacterium]|nr:S-layer homology domain-containing protein [Clostridiales bacterium]
MKHIKTILGITLAVTVISGMIFSSGSSVNAAGSVKINKTNFPDDNFRSYISENFDTDKDGVLSSSERNAVDNIAVGRSITKYDNDGTPIAFEGDLIKSVKGIEYFPNLMILQCAVNEITSIDTSKNPNLNTLTCSINKITKLDLSKNKYLEFLDCKNNKLTGLNVSKNTNLVGLDCGYNALKNIDLSKNLKLESLYCEESLLSTLDLSCNTKLKNLSCLNNNLTAIDLSKLKDLRDLNVKSNRLTSLDVSANKKLEYIIADNNKLKSLNLNGYNNLLMLHATENEFSSVKISKCAKLDELELKKNKSLTKVQVTDCPKLTQLNFSRCKVSELNVKGCTSLDLVGASATYLKKLDATLLPGKHLRTFFAIYTNEGNDNDNSTGSAVGDYCYKIDHPSVAKQGFIDYVDTIFAKAPGSTSITVTYCDRNKLPVLPTNILQALDKNDPEPFAKAYPQYTHRIKVNLTVVYKDVLDENDFWYKPTYALSAKGVVKGYDNQTKFKPANDCTRAQMVTFLWRLAGSPAPKSGTCNFSDVKKDDYYYKAVIWAVEQGITTGVSKTEFAPSKVCTRAQTVTFLWRMAGKPSVGTAKNPFSDVNSKDYFYNAVIWASSQKIVAGYSDGTFRPQGKCLRRQMVTFLYKFDKAIKIN